MLLLFGSFALLIVIGVPIAYCLIGSSVIWMLANDFSLVMVTKCMASGVNKFSLLSMMFFVLAGAVMNHAGVTGRIFDFANKLVGHHRGGLGHANIFASVIFSGMSGSAVADTGGLGAIELKAMKDAGYDEDFSLAVTGASSCIGPIIPPSVPGVVFCVAAEVSVGRLFTGGMIPGLLMAIAMCVLVSMTSIKRGYAKQPKAKPKEVLVSFKRAFFPILTPIIIIGGIMFSIITPSEAGVIAVAYALILGVVYGNLNLKTFVKIIGESLNTSASILLIIAGSTAFGWILTASNVPQTVASFFLENVSSPVVALLILNVILLIVGMFMETAAAILLLVPIFVPIASIYGISLVHLGIIMVLNLMIGLLTPPVGLVLYVLSSVSKTPFERIVKAIWPYMICLLVVLILIIFFEPIVTWLPNLLYGPELL